MKTYDDSRTDVLIWQAIAASDCPEDFRRCLRLGLIRVMREPIRCAHEDPLLCNEPKHHDHPSRQAFCS